MRRPLISWIVCCLLAPCLVVPALGVDFGAVGSGNWNSAATWTPAGGPPGGADNAFVGSNTPAGSAANATVTLTADQSVSNLTIGRGVGSTGTLNLGNFVLSVGQALSLNPFGGSGSITRGIGRFTTNNLFVSSAGAFTYAATDVSNILNVSSGASVTTSNLGNVTGDVQVFDMGSQLGLGANLSVTNDVDLRGTAAVLATLNAGGFNVTARDIFVGRSGNAAQIINDGAIQATRNFIISRGTFAFDANDTVAGGLFVDTGGSATLVPTTQLDFIQLGSAATTTVVATGNVTDTVNVFDANSQLTLGANLSLALDLDIRGTGATHATVDAANFNITARDIYIGRFNQIGQILNDGAITVTRNLSVSRGTFAFDANDTVAGGVFADSAASVTFVPTTQVDFIQLDSGASTTVVATGNVTDTVNVFGSTSQLTLAANLSLVQDLDVRGTGVMPATVNAAGFNLTARDLFVGRFGQAGQILNDGAIQVTRNLSVSGSPFAFDANDTVAGGLFADSSATVTMVPQTQLDFVQLNSGATTVTVATGNITDSVAVFDGTSQLTLGAHLSLTQDIDLRGTGATPSTLNAGGFNLSARDIFVGRFGNAGQIINDGAVAASRNFGVSRGTFTFDANDTVGDGLFVDQGGQAVLVAATQVDSIQLNSGGTTTIVATGNVTESVAIFDSASQLSLNAAMSISQDLDIRGTGATPATVQAAGFGITARDVFLGRFGNAGQIVNDGPITVTRNLAVSAGPFSFDSNDTVAGGLFADTGASVSMVPTTQVDFIQLASGATATVVATGNVTESVAVLDQNSVLTLAANLALTSDVDLRGTAASPATLNAAGFSITARDIYVGRFNNAGQVLNDGAISATRNFAVSRSTFAFDANDTVAGGLTVSDVSTVSTATTTQIADFVQVFGPGSQLNLGASLNLTSDLDIRGNATTVSTVDANGVNVSARSIFVGRFGSQGSLLDVALLTANTTLEVNTSTLLLDGGFDLAGQALVLGGNAALHVNQAADGTRGFSLEGQTLTIADTSTLNLTFDATLDPVGDWIFRWRNPMAGDRVATLNGLIGSGRITVSSPHPFVIIDNGDGFTYIAKFSADFTGDNRLNCGDINALTAAIVAGSTNPVFDLTGDGLVTIADRDAWLAGAGRTFLRSGNPYLPGDANLDGVVDGSDFGIWNANKFTSNSAWCSGDFNTDGFIDGSDFGIWNSRKFTSSAGTQAVPEPGFGWCAMIAFISWAKRGHGSRKSRGFLQLVS